MQISEDASTWQTYSNIFINSASTWQKEVWDISDISSGNRDAIRYVRFTVTDDTSSFTLYLDDIKAGGFLTNPSATDNIPSTMQRYFQYRAVLTTTSPTDTPILNSVSIDYYDNTEPGIPTLDSPSNGATNISLTPQLKTTAIDARGDYLRYKIQIATDSDFTENVQTFDQTESQTGWSGQDAEEGTAYASDTQATYTIQTPLSPNETYYWRSYAIDPGGSNIWGGTQSSPYSFSTGNLNPPLKCLLNDGGQPDQLIVSWIDDSSLEDRFRIEVSIDGGNFSFLINVDTPTVSYTDNSVSSNHTYQYQIRAETTSGTSGDWCTTSTVNYAKGNLQLKGVIVR
jgi:hypothetical protein